MLSSKDKWRRFQPNNEQKLQESLLSSPVWCVTKGVILQIHLRADLSGSSWENWSSSESDRKFPFISKGSLMSEPGPVITIDNRSLPSALRFGWVKSVPVPWSGWMDEEQGLFFPIPTYQQNLQICNLTNLALSLQYTWQTFRATWGDHPDISQ